MSNFQSHTTWVAPAEQPKAPQVAARIHDSSLSVTVVDGVATETERRYTKGSSAQNNPYFGTDSFGASAMNPSGLPVTELLPTTLVTIDGVQAPVSFWVKEGKLQQAADGTYDEATVVPEEAPVKGDILPLTDEAMAQIGRALETVQPQHVDGLLAAGMGVAVGRLTPEALAYKFAQASGHHADNCGARMATIQGAFQAQADAALTSRSGVTAADLPDFYAWARENCQGQLQAAVAKQVHNHDVSGYKALADQWMAAYPPTIDAIKAAGLPVRGQGVSSEVWLQGQWMTPKAAAKMGLI